MSFSFCSNFGWMNCVARKTRFKNRILGHIITKMYLDTIPCGAECVDSVVFCNQCTSL